MRHQMTDAMLKAYRDELKDRIHDPERLRRVYGSRFLDKKLHDKLQAVVRQAAQMLGAQSAFINLLKEDELIFAVSYNYDTSSPLETHESYCQHVIMSDGEPFAVGNGDHDTLVCDLKIVTEARLLSYLGVPLIDRDGYVMGSMCVTNDDNRDWRPNDAFLLSSFAATAMEIAGYR